MKPLMTSALIAGFVLAAGCATQPGDTAAQAMADSKGDVAQVKSEPSTMLGSRIPRKSTDRSLKQVGNQEYRDDNQIKSIANDPAFRAGQ